MPRFLSLTMLFSALVATAGAAETDWGLRIDVDGRHNKIALTPNGEYVKNIAWGPEEGRGQALFVQKKGVPDTTDGQPFEFTFSFVPKGDGAVVIALNGCFAKRAGQTAQDALWVDYLRVSAEGCALKNGDFADRDDKGRPKDWELRGGARVLPQGVSAWNLAQVAQHVTVKRDVPVTVKVQARKGPVEEAKPPAKPLAFRHGPWSLTVDADSGAWRALEHRGRALGTNPGGFAPFTINGADGAAGPRSLASHAFDAATGELRLVTRRGDWEMEEVLLLGDRLRRELFFTWRGGEVRKFTSVNFELCMPRKGRFYFPRFFFGDNRGSYTIMENPEHWAVETGRLEELKVGSTLQGVFDVYFAFYEPEPGFTVMLGADGREESNRASLRVFDAFVAAGTYTSACGWAEPGVTQRVGPLYIEALDAPLEQALRAAPHRWFRDLDFLPPADRPEWVWDASVYEVGASPSLAGADGARGLARYGFPRIRRMGFNLLWLMPVEELFPYGPRDFYALRAEVGSWDDYRRMIELAHGAGLRVWQDIVPHGGKAEFAKMRGVGPAALVVNEDGKSFRQTMPYDYGSDEWRAYMRDVADHYMKSGLDGFRIDSAGTVGAVSWRRRGFPAEAPEGVDGEWFRAGLAATGGVMPATEYPRASYATRRAGARLTADLREITRRNRDDGAVVAETDYLSCVPSADAIWDFHFRQLRYELPRFSGGEFARLLGRWLDEQQWTDPPDTLRLRFFDIHDNHMRLNQWVGDDAAQALLSTMFFIKGLPSGLQGRDLGKGLWLRRLNEVRTALPELRRGEALYQAVSCEPPAFAPLRVLPDGRASVGVVSFSREAATFRLTLPLEEMGFAPDERVVLYEALRGRTLGSGAAKDFARHEIELPAWGSALLTFRRAGEPNPVPPPSPRKLSQPGRDAPPWTLRENGRDGDGEWIVAGARELAVDRRTGLLKRFGDLLGPASLLTDREPAQGNDDAPAEVLARVDGAAVTVTARRADGVTLEYRVEGDELLLTATLDPGAPGASGASGSSGQRAALLLSMPNARRWEVNAADGHMEDEFDPGEVDPGLRGYYDGKNRYPTVSPVLWDSEWKPLSPAAPLLRAFDAQGVGLEIEPDDPADPAFDGALLLNTDGAAPGLRTAWFWTRPGPLSTARDGEPRRFVLRLSPARSVGRPEPKAAEFGPVRIAHESMDWRVETDAYLMRLDRGGGVVRSFHKRGDNAPLAENHDVFSPTGPADHYTRADQRRSTVTADPETGARLWRDADGAPRLRFLSILRDRTHWGLIRPPVWVVNEYVFRADRVESFTHISRDRGASVPVFWRLDTPAGREERALALKPGSGWSSFGAVFGPDGVDIPPTPTSATAPAFARIAGLSPDRAWGIHEHGLTGRRWAPLIMEPRVPGAWFDLIVQPNIRFVDGDAATTAVEFTGPIDWFNFNVPVDLPAGSYRVLSRMRGQGIVPSPEGSPKPLILRVIGRQKDGQAFRLEQRHDFPAGDFDGRELVFPVELPEGLQNVELMLGMYRFYGSGTVCVDLPEIGP